MDLNQQIIVHSTDGITEYPSAKDFIESLVNHLKIESELPAGMTMISAGETAPAEEYQDSPWMELDESGNPIALKFYNGASWVDIVPYKAVKSLSDSQYIQRGSGILEVKQAVRQTWIHSLDLFEIAGLPSEFKFAVPFKSGATLPTVQIIPKKSSVHKDSSITGDMTNKEISDESDHFDVVMGTVTNSGFTIWTKSWTAIEAGSELSFEFDYIATGEMVE